MQGEERRYRCLRKRGGCGSRVGRSHGSFCSQMANRRRRHRAQTPLTLIPASPRILTVLPVYRQNICKAHTVLLSCLLLQFFFYSEESRYLILEFSFVCCIPKSTLFPFHAAASLQASSSSHNKTHYVRLLEAQKAILRIELTLLVVGQTYVSLSLV